MAFTYEPIQSVAATGSSVRIDLTSIPATYTDLILVFSGFAPAGNLYVRVNTTGGTSYSQTSLRGNGSVAGASRETNTDAVYIGDFISDPISTISNAVLHFYNYANTTTFKSFLLRGNNSAKFTDLAVGLFRSTSAITALTLHSSNMNFDATSVVTLYGVKAA